MKWLICINLLLIVTTIFAVELPLINITQGLVLGSVAASGAYYEFYGIPYAETSKSTRFKVRFVL